MGPDPDPTPLSLSNLFYFEGQHPPPLGHLLSLSLAPTLGSQLQTALCRQGFYCGPVLSFHISLVSDIFRQPACVGPESRNGCLNISAAPHARLYPSPPQGLANGDYSVNMC